MSARMGTLTAAAHRLAKIAPPKVDPTKQFAPSFPLEVWGHFGLTPYKHQVAPFLDPRRFRVDVWHRRAGKSTKKLMKVLERAYRSPFKRARYAFIGPTYSQIEDITWAELKTYAEIIPGAIIQEAKLAVMVPTWHGDGDMARIRLYGVDSPKQRLRGSYLDGVILDEFQDIPEHVWPLQVRPMLSDKSRRGTDTFGRPNQWADFIGTPKGRNQLFKFHDRARQWDGGGVVTYRDEGGTVRTVASKDWAATLLTVNDTDAVNPEELESIRADVSPTQFAQEFMCDFDAGVEGSIFRLELEALRQRGGVIPLPYNPNLAVYTGWDLGWNDMTVVWFYQRVEMWNNFIDCLPTVNASIPRLAELIREKKYRLATNYFPHDVAVHELGEGKSRAANFRSAGIKPTPVRKTLLPDQIASARRFLGKCVFSTSCSEGLDMLSLYRREKDKNTGLVREEPVHDASSHYASAFMTASIGTPRWTMEGTQSSMVQMDAGADE